MSLAAWWRGLWASPSPIPAAPADALGAATLPHDAVLIPPVPSSAEPSVAVLRALDWDKPDVWSAALTRACALRGIHTRLRLAAFLANVGHETNGGRRLTAWPRLPV